MKYPAPLARGGEIKQREDDIVMFIEGGSWCKKYGEFIGENLKNKCPRWNEDDFRGCTGSGCEHVGYASIVKTDLHGEIISQTVR